MSSIKLSVLVKRFNKKEKKNKLQIWKEDIQYVPLCGRKEGYVTFEIRDLTHEHFIFVNITWDGILHEANNEHMEMCYNLIKPYLVGYDNIEFDDEDMIKKINRDKNIVKENEWIRTIVRLNDKRRLRARK